MNWIPIKDWTKKTGYFLFAGPKDGPMPKFMIHTHYDKKLGFTLLIPSVAKRVTHVLEPGWPEGFE